VSDRGFVITRPYRDSGLGNNLLSMVGALYLCERTGRSLIVDWTENEHLVDKRTNYFVKFFEPLRRWRGVEIFYVNDDEADQPVHYDLSDVVRLDGGPVREALSGAITARYVFLEALHYRAVFDHCEEMTATALFHYTRGFYRSLVPRPAVLALLGSRRAGFDGRTVIGLNVRTGNGHPLFLPGAVYERRFNQTILTRADFPARAYQACRDCASRLPDDVRGDFGVFVVSDDPRMQRRLVDTIPNAFAVRQHFPPPGVGHAFAGFHAQGYPDYSDIDAVHETIVDMLLLAECQGLVCNYTEFNRYPRYVTTFYNGNVGNLEHYFDHPVRRVGRRVVHGLHGLRRRVGGTR